MQRLILISAVIAVAITGAGQSGRPETSLAGVTLGASISEVRRVLGDPTRVVDAPAKDVDWRAGERQYIFVRDHSVVKVLEGYYKKSGMQSEHSSGVVGIAVEGNGPLNKTIKTGLGLSLGDSVQTIRKLYGRVPLVERHFQIHWSNGSILDIDLDSQGKVSEIDLSLDQE